MVGDRWIRAGVVGTFLCAGFSAWQVYRGEHPITETARVTPSAGWVVAFPFIISSAMLLAAVWLAFIHKTTKHTQIKLVIHAARYGIGESNAIDVTDKLKSFVLDNRLALTVSNWALSATDPYPNQWKHLKIDYSFG